VGQSDVAIVRLRHRKQAVEGSGLLGIGKGNGGKRGVWPGLLGNGVYLRESVPLQGFEEETLPASMEGGVGDAN